MDHLPFHTVQVPVAPGYEYHRVTAEVCTILKCADGIAAGKHCPIFAAWVGDQSLQVGDGSSL